MPRHGNSVVRRVQRRIMRGGLDAVLLAANANGDKETRRDHVRNCCRAAAMHVHVANFQTKKTQMSLRTMCRAYSIKPRTLDRCISSLRRCGMLFTTAAAHVVCYTDFYNGGKKVYRIKAATRVLTELFFDRLKMNKQWIENAIAHANNPPQLPRDHEVEKMLAAGAHATVIHIVQWKLRHNST